MNTTVKNNVPIEADYLKFKNILKYFVHILNANHQRKQERRTEEFFGDEAKAGRGYKNNRIRKSYANFREYSNGHTLDVTVVAGYALYSKSCYIHWTETGINIRALWDDTKTKIVSLQIYNNAENVFVGEPVELNKLELYNDQAPNSVLKEFFNHYVDVFNKSDYYIYGVERGIPMKVQNLMEQLSHSYNLILRGAPGTGKTYLARQIAAHMISEGRTCEIENLTEAEKEQLGFVQFHPSYDYTDFVEGLRPVSVDGQVGFEPKNGIFKDFCQNAKMSKEVDFDHFDQVWEKFIDAVEEDGEITINRLKKSPVDYVLNSNRNLKIEKSNHSLTRENIYAAWQGKKGRKSGSQQAIMKSIVQYLEEHFDLPKYDTVKGKTQSSNKKYVFIIDEINRGEISKIFGELFFSLDPDYRGVKGSVTTQYANLFDEEAFYIPENVYIIGTMNDIDRSVDTFDFAMRRRFTFEEITAEDSQVMLKRDYVKQMMTNLNDKIISSEIGLTLDYQIGGSYFKALDEEMINEEFLWESKLKPLLKDYFRGERAASDKLEKLERAYLGDSDDTTRG